MARRRFLTHNFFTACFFSTMLVFFGYGAPSPTSSSPASSTSFVLLVHGAPSPTSSSPASSHVVPHPVTGLLPPRPPLPRPTSSFLLRGSSPPSSHTVVKACWHTAAPRDASWKKVEPVKVAPGQGCLCGSKFFKAGARYSCWQDAAGEFRYKIHSQPSWEGPGGTVDQPPPSARLPPTVSGTTTGPPDGQGGGGPKKSAIVLFVLGGLFLVVSVAMAILLLCCCARKGGRGGSAESSA